MSIFSGLDRDSVPITFVPPGFFHGVLPMTRLHHLGFRKSICTTTLFAVALLPCSSGSGAAPSGTAYVANTSSDTISVVNLTSQSVVNTIPVGDGPRYVAFAPNGSRAYVTNSNSDSISIIDTTLQMAIGTINVGDVPEQIVITDDGQRAYVANSNSASISVIDLSTNIVNTFATAPNPFSLALHPTRDELWIGFNSGGTVIDARSLSNHSSLGTATSLSRAYASGGLAIWPDGSMAIGSEVCGFCGRFHKISGNIGVNTISPLQQDILFDDQGSARGVAINPISEVAYLAKLGQNGGSNRVVEFGGAGRTLFSGDPRELLASSDGQYVYLTQLTSGGGNPGSVAIIDANTFSIVNTIPVGLAPHGIAIRPIPEPVSLALAAMACAAILLARFRPVE
jgi:YVTN family beta-propeller protein